MQTEQYCLFHLVDLIEFGYDVREPIHCCIQGLLDSVCRCPHEIHNSTSLWTVVTTADGVRAENVRCFWKELFGFIFLSRWNIWQEKRFWDLYLSCLWKWLTSTTSHKTVAEVWVPQLWISRPLACVSSLMIYIVFNWRLVSSFWSQYTQQCKFRGCSTSPCCLLMLMHYCSCRGLYRFLACYVD